MSRILNRRRLLKLGGLLLGALVLVLLAWAVVAGPVTVLRVLRYGDTNIDDYSHYPGRELQPAVTALPWPRAEGTMQLPASTLAGYGGQTDLDGLLAANDTIAFVVASEGAILYERTFQGHAPSAISQLFSVSKSVTSALVGMAIADGYLEDIEQPITAFIPELAAQGFTQVTLHDALTMTSGSRYQENDNPFGEHVILNYTPRLEEKILAFETEAPPATVFRYKSGDNALLGLALARALGSESITQYAQRRLWTPLGMQDRAVWTIDHEGDGLEKTWCCLATSARDLARFGQLYLNQGTWDGRQIVPASWVAQSTRGHVPPGEWPDDYLAAGWHNYGYQWWLASEAAGDYFALGKDGQFLYISPATETVIVRLGWSQGDLFSSEWVALFQAIAEAASLGG